MIEITLNTCLPPMAIVKVTPITADNALVVPSMLSPRVASFDIMYVPKAPTFPRRRPRFIG